MLLLAQFRSPIILTLLVAVTLSFSLRDATDALIILAIVLISGLLGFWQEWGAADAVAKLLALVQVRATVLREDRPVEVPVEQVVPGDVVVLDAGDVIPGDGRILEARDLFVSEATLTGETFPVEKGVGLVPPDAPLARRTNCLYLGTSVVSGTARLLVVHTGRQTEFGRVSEALRLRPPETEFERGIRRFGSLLLPAAGGHPPAGRGRAPGHRRLREARRGALRLRPQAAQRAGPRDGAHRIITKGALAGILEVCSTAEAATGDRVELSALRPQIERRFGGFSDQGYRVLGVAYGDVGAETGIDKGHEAGLTFLGLLVFDDPLRAGIVETLRKLHDLGVALKLITGDNSQVAAHVARQAGRHGPGSSRGRTCGG
jgi:magnesium-transporting ATPase (P-type)